MSFDWSKFQDGTRFKFVQAGDHVEGEIMRITTTTFGGSSLEPVPQLDIKTANGTVLQVTAGQVVLLNRLAECNPDIGDMISITYTGDDKPKPGRSAAKLFDVVVTPKTLAAAPAAATDPANEPF